MTGGNGGEEPRWFEGINGKHSRRLIASDSKVIKVLAGPGAGKTTCLKRRVIRLVDEKVATRREIFVGTFTRVIAKSLDDAFRPQTADGLDNDDRVTVATLHSHAARLLRENPDAAQGRKFRFLLDYEEKAMLYDISGRVPQFRNHNERFDELKKLQATWAERRTLDDARFGAAVEEWLRMHGGMLLGEVVHIATNAIQSGDLDPGRFKHVFVDEYQDLTQCEQVFVDLLVKNDGEGSIVVLGDNDQSIYGFRHNHPEGIEAFPSDDARKGVVEEVPLPDNFRCAKKIVTLANEIAAAAQSKKAAMIAASEEEGRVDFVRWDSLEEEIEGLAKVIEGRKDTNFLVLVTRQFIGYRLKRLLSDDAVTTFREEVLTVPFVRERFALATLLADESDAVSLRAWFAFHGKKPDNADNRNAEAYQSLHASGKQGLDLITGIADGGVPVTGEGRTNIIERSKSYLEFKKSAPADLKELLQALFDPAQAGAMPGRPIPAKETDAQKTGRERLEAQDRDKARGDLDLIRRSALHIMTTMEEPSLGAVIKELRYRIGTQAPLLDDDAVPRVRIMTLHGAKGLEEDAVIVAGVADEIIPGPPNPTGAANAKRVEEQRRLLYVAVTRAKKELVLSWSTSIASADTSSNAIVQKRILPPPRNGVLYRALTRTTLLPPSVTPPTRGSAWIKSELERSE